MSKLLFVVAVVVAVVGSFAPVVHGLKFQPLSSLAFDTASKTLPGASAAGYAATQTSPGAVLYLCRTTDAEANNRYLGTLSSYDLDGSSSSTAPCQVPTPSGPGGGNLTRQVEVLTGTACWVPTLGAGVSVAGWPTFAVIPGYYDDPRISIGACRAVIDELTLAIGSVQFVIGQGATCSIYYNGVETRPPAFETLAAC